MKRFIFLLPIVYLFFACGGPNTCHPLGDTFISVELDTTPNISSISLNLVTLDTLPDTYFREGSLWRLKNDHDGNAFNNLAEGSTLNLITANRLEIDLPSPSNISEEVGFSIVYPDRKEFVTCEHPGSGDSYVLFLYFDYLPDGQVENFRWVEDYRPGGF